MTVQLSEANQAILKLTMGQLPIEAMDRFMNPAKMDTSIISFFVEAVKFGSSGFNAMMARRAITHVLQQLHDLLEIAFDDDPVVAKLQREWHAIYQVRTELYLQIYDTPYTDTSWV